MTYKWFFIEILNNFILFGKYKSINFFERRFILSWYENYYMEIEKHLSLSGTSKISWKDAIVRTIAEAGKTVRNLKQVTLISQKAKITDNKISEYYVELDLTFSVDKAN